MMGSTKKLRQIIVGKLCIYKTIAFVLAMMLLVSDFNLFFVENPIISIKKHEKQTNDKFPLILLCNAASDVGNEKLQELGFASFSHFLVGIIGCDERCEISFGGRSRVDTKYLLNHIFKLSDVISTISLSFEGDSSLEHIHGRDIKFHRYFSLQGFCYSIDLTNKFEKTIRNIRLSLNNTYMQSMGIPYMSVYLAPKNTNIGSFFTQPFAMGGDR